MDMLKIKEMFLNLPNKKIDIVQKIIKQQQQTQIQDQHDYKRSFMQASYCTHK